MIWVEPGTFTMGSPITEAGRGGHETEHNVTLTKGFYLGKYEVTQAQYEAVMTGNTDSLSATPSNWPNNPNRPVEQVSHDDIQIFLSRLNTQQSATYPRVGLMFCPPSRNGNMPAVQGRPRCTLGAMILMRLGLIIILVSARLVMWAIMPPTRGAFSICMEMSMEWTADWYDGTYPVGNPVIDPTGAASGSYRVLGVVPGLRRDGPAFC